ncbi:MAG: phage tail protein, partial [bacterium]|nr:phage tail protein [bacterium]
MSTEEVLSSLVKESKNRYYGKYRGIVTGNDDPKNLGRLIVQVPSLLKEENFGWATPCVPYGGSADLGFFFIPEVGAGVWIEFEEGELDHPIWVGTYWRQPGGENQVPRPMDDKGAEAGNKPAPPTCNTIKTKVGHTIQLDDTDKQEMITIVEAKHNHVFTMDNEGITMTDGTNKHDVVMDKNGITLTAFEDKKTKIIMAKESVTIT